MTKIYLAWIARGHETIAKMGEDDPLDLLVAYPFLDDFERLRKDYNIRSWCLDSGAFSVWNSGKVIKVEDYIARCKDVDADEIFGLDVIGDAEATRRNLELQWAAGQQVIPTFHGHRTKGAVPDPDWVLEWACENAPKIAISYMGKKRLQWIKHVMSRIWPKPVHGFAMTGTTVMDALPFHSVDSTTWNFGPAAMGRFVGYNGKQERLGARRLNDFRIEVYDSLRRAEKYAYRWRHALKELGPEWQLPPR